MAIFDIIYVLIAIILITSGLIRGFIFEITSLINIILGIYIANKYYSQAAKLIKSSYISPPLDNILGYIIILIIIVITTSIISRAILRILKALQLTFLNRLAGGIIGLLKATCLACVGMFVIVGLNLSTEAGLQNSRIAPYINNINQHVVHYIPNIISESYKKNTNIINLQNKNITLQAIQQEGKKILNVNKKQK